MGARSKRLAGPIANIGTTAQQLLYTVPAGITALVKSVRCVNHTASSRTLVLGVGGVANSQQLLKTSVSAGVTYTEDREAPFVLHSGESLFQSIQGGTSAAGDFTTTISGAEVTA